MNKLRVKKDFSILTFLKLKPDISVSICFVINLINVSMFCNCSYPIFNC